MALFQGIRDYFAKREIQQLRKSKRMRKVVNYHQAKEVGIIYPSDSESTFGLVKHFIEYLKEEHGIVHILALGFVNEKEPPFYHKHALNHDYFTLEDLNWKGLPDCQATNGFIDKDFDILIDLSKGDTISLSYVLERSKARFKVGRLDDSDSYDLLMSMKLDSTLDQYIRQINHFLSSINHHEERKRV